MELVGPRKLRGHDSDGVEKGKRKDPKSWNRYLLAGGLAMTLGLGCNDVNVTKSIPIPGAPQNDAAVSDGSGVSPNGLNDAGTVNDSKGPVDDSGKTRAVSVVDGGTESDGGAITDSGEMVDGNESDGNITNDDAAENPNVADGGVADGSAQQVDGAENDAVNSEAGSKETGQQLDGAVDSAADAVSGIDGRSQNDGTFQTTDAEDDSGAVAIDGGEADGSATDAGHASDARADAVLISDTAHDSASGNDSVAQHDANVADTNKTDTKLNACNNPGAGTYHGYMSPSVPVQVGGFAFEYEGLGTSDADEAPVKISIKCGSQAILPATLFPIGVESVLDTVDNKRIRILPSRAGIGSAFVDIVVEELPNQSHDGGTDAGITDGGPATDGGTCDEVATGSFLGYVPRKSSVQVAGYDVYYSRVMSSDAGNVVGATFDITYDGTVIASGKDCPLGESTNIPTSNQIISITPERAGMGSTYVDIKVTCP